MDKRATLAALVAETSKANLLRAEWATIGFEARLGREVVRTCVHHWCLLFDGCIQVSVAVQVIEWRSRRSVELRAWKHLRGGRLDVRWRLEEIRHLLLVRSRRCEVIHSRILLGWRCRWSRIRLRNCFDRWFGMDRLTFVSWNRELRLCYDLVSWTIFNQALCEKETGLRRESNVHSVNLRLVLLRFSALTRDFFPLTFRKPLLLLNDGRCFFHFCCSMAAFDGLGSNRSSPDCVNERSERNDPVELMSSTFASIMYWWFDLRFFV